MNPGDARGHLSPILGLLDDERQALVTGQLDKLMELMERKSAMLSDLRSAPLSKSEIELLAVKTQQNQHLFAAALKGAQSAKQRIEAAQQVQQGFSVYDRRGTSQTLRNSAQGHNRSA